MKYSSCIVEYVVNFVGDGIVFVELLVVVSVYCVLVCFEGILLESGFVILDFECYSLVILGVSCVVNCEI